MQNVVIIGAGGHGKVVRELVKERPDTELAGILDDRYAELHVENGLHRGLQPPQKNLRYFIRTRSSSWLSAKTASDSGCMNALVFRLTGMRF